MDTNFSDLLSRAGQFSEEEQQLLKEELQFHTFTKEEYLLIEGTVCSKVYFLVKGSAVQYVIDEEEERHIIDLHVARDWVLDHQSFTTRQPSKHSIQCYEDCTAYILSIEAIHRLIAKSQAFFQLGKILGETANRIQFFDQKHSPDEKYRSVVKNRPALLQSFPQKYIASYLKISPETLSRVRGRFLNP